MMHIRYDNVWSGSRDLFQSEMISKIDLFHFCEQPYSSMSEGGMVHNSYWNMGASCNCRFCPTISRRRSGITDQCQLVQLAFLFNCIFFLNIDYIFTFSLITFVISVLFLISFDITRLAV